MSKKIGFSSMVVFLAVLSLTGFSASSALAVKEFKDAFQAKYIKPNSNEEKDVALAQAFEQANCSVCHAGGENKRIRNDYGKQLAKLLRKEDKRNRAKIEAALDAVAKLKSKSADATSPTFGEKIASGKLPATASHAGPADDFGPPGPPPDDGRGRPDGREDREPGPPRGPDGPPDGPDDHQSGRSPDRDGPPNRPGSLGPGQPPGDQPFGPRPDWPELQRNDPEIFKFIRAENDLGRRTREAAREYREASKDQRTILKEDLKKLVAEQFETRQQRRKLELTRFEAELKRLRDAADRREKNKPQIIEKRVSEQSGEEADAGF